MDEISRRIAQMSLAPTGSAEFEEWTRCEDAQNFLLENAGADRFLVYAGFAHVFVHSVFVANNAVSPPNAEDLLNWNAGIDSGWGISYSFDGSSSVSLTPPFDHSPTKTLEGAQPLIFYRSFEGRRGETSYFELFQPFGHVFELHYMRERNAYCRLDGLGDIEDVVKILRLEDDAAARGTLITCRRDILNEWMALNDASIVRMFDFTRFRTMAFGGWPTHARHLSGSGDLVWRGVIEPGRAGYIRGVQIVRSPLTKGDLYRKLNGKDAERQYVSFLAHDFKNDALREISTAPAATANYFTPSELPFETSPAFFRPEVLMKYKADSEKYRLRDRVLSCRGTWSLQTFDINDQGQVHTYICYLRRLPYEEQLHWKAYNEAPKAPISERAFRTDFEGDFYHDYDPLVSIRARMKGWADANLTWWKLRAEDLLDRVHYPMTASADEWATELLHLDQLVVEGFDQKWLRQRAKELGRAIESQWGSLKLLNECLLGLGFEEQHASGIISPLRELHELRSKVKGHAAGSEANEIKVEAERKHGNFKAHFADLCQRCDRSLRSVTRFISATAIEWSQGIQFPDSPFVRRAA